MIDRMGEAFARLISEQVSRRSVIAKCGKMLAVVVAGPALARVLGAGETVEALSNEIPPGSQPGGEVDPLHYAGHCDLCYYCGMWAVPCSHCGATSDSSPCPQGSAAGSWMVCCPCPTQNFLVYYQDCCGASEQCGGIFCDRNAQSPPQGKRAYAADGGDCVGYYCTRVILSGGCSNPFQKTCPNNRC